MSRNVLTETKKYKLTHEWETPILVDKRTSMKITLREHYGDPTCGLINHKQDICVVGGYGLSVYLIKDNKEIMFLENKHIHSIKEDRDNFIKILIDPWSNDHGVYILDLTKLKIDKISEKPDLRNFPYRDHVDF